MLVHQHKITLANDQEASRLYDLELFKMLLQPHFLFNSLNNLYALSVKKSDQTTDAIAGLSELLEKVVTYSRQDYISLTNEVNLIRDYIKLERIWLGDTSFLLDLKVSGNLGDILIPPLVLYTFVENSFKHGIRKCADTGWLTIKIEVKKNQLYFSAVNLIPEWDCELAAHTAQHAGLGMAAARELLENKCSGRFILNTGRKGNAYCVDLLLDTTERKQ